MQLQKENTSIGLRITTTIGKKNGSNWKLKKKKFKLRGGASLAIRSPNREQNIRRKNERAKEDSGTTYGQCVRESHSENKKRSTERTARYKGGGEVPVKTHKTVQHRTLSKETRKNYPIGCKGPQTKIKKKKRLEKYHSKRGET